MARIATRMSSGYSTSGLPLSQAIVIVAGLAIATLDVSSLSTSGIRAIMTSIPALAVVGALAPLLARLTRRTMDDQIASARLGGFRSGPV